MILLEWMRMDLWHILHDPNKDKVSQALLKHWKGDGWSLPIMLKYCVGVARGVHALRVHGIVHRDLKSSNCLVDVSGNVKRQTIAQVVRRLEALYSPHKATLGDEDEDEADPVDYDDDSEADEDEGEAEDEDEAEDDDCLEGAEDEQQQQEEAPEGERNDADANPDPDPDSDRDTEIVDVDAYCSSDSEQAQVHEQEVPNKDVIVIDD